MHFTVNESTDKKSVLKKIVSKNLLLFIASYVVFFIISAVQLNAGEFVMQESGNLDSITSYDYIIPIIDSLAMVLTLAAFTLAGYYAYGKDKIKMLRYPMAFSLSGVVGNFISSVFMALLSTPLIDLSALGVNFIELQSAVVILIRLVVAVLFFLYYDSEESADYYYSDAFYDSDYSSGKGLRGRILSSRLSTLWTVVVVYGGSVLAESFARSLMTAFVVRVPEDFYWIGYYVDVVTGIFAYGSIILLTWYFSPGIRASAKFLGVIYFVGDAMGGFSFIINSISNSFAQADDSWLNTVFSYIFVSVVQVVFSVIKVVIIVLLCSFLRKKKEQEEYY